uniref:Uncharacterized protein n=1 Tax=Cynoglossus semilaevis TaxID=244447 RepID=A0A3P8VEL5_CYNSE
KRRMWKVGGDSGGGESVQDINFPAPSCRSLRTYCRRPPAPPACCRAPEVQAAQRRRPSWLRPLCYGLDMRWSSSTDGDGWRTRGGGKDEIQTYCMYI